MFSLFREHADSEYDFLFMYKTCFEGPSTILHCRHILGPKNMFYTRTKKIILAPKVKLVSPICGCVSEEEKRQLDFMPENRPNMEVW